ncbi:hypothetical protein XENTR_v10000139 [Xenopus tropicalis]|uniref:Progonadoliberin n=1 Tax=Xenopus tropicalis TaxID=8364 RepID=F6PN24_XENTR|nr:progonadoliberin-2 precursor [Xenopus tropicalis]XP_012809671.1 progonadoliberin-2 isoform X1 [Xenopus tropicalis]ABO77121.1 gonadotropin-releasing hormone 2 [Xenopus tropicalis]KAE8628617.1 hypothetical protein XENTR_v10000139 [Xenopus tropicalis]|eukprot:NP_001107550.1 progonadoliberin-2 precursor [Xenopus tropicalis]
MACQGHLVLLLIVLFAFSTHLSNAQHWSHGWYPGGKRQLDTRSFPEISDELKPCEGESCDYPMNEMSILKGLLTRFLFPRERQRK